MNQICNECGTTVPDDMPGHRCPRCILSLALDTGYSYTLMSEDGENPPQLLGDYELQEEIARGGMGVVYRARQISLKRTVALKLILTGQFASKKEVQRFRGEAEAAAHLKHPSIVPIYETGEHKGQHYFSMEYVCGRNLSEIVREGLPPARLAGQYVETIALAIHYAHQQGILHRDLKPSNILIDGDGRPRVTDFGLAMRIDGNSDLTATGQLLGSPNFMPPEQAAGEEAKIGPWSDVYGIGAILYHLLTGRPPFQAEALKDLIRHLHTTDPVAPGLLNPNVPRDLETICLKCLEKEPNRRYPTALELAEELARFREDQPILARPMMAPERLVRWARRRPVVTGLLGGLVAAVALGLAGIWYQLRQVRSIAADLRERVYASEMNLANQAFSEKNLGRAIELLRHHIPKAGETDLRGFEWRYLWGLCRGDEIATLTGQEAEVSSLAITPDGRWLITGSFYHTIKVWDLPSRKLQQTLHTFPKKIGLNSVAVSSDGRLLAATDEESLIVWEIEKWSKIKQLNEARLPITFLRGGRTLLAVSGDPGNPEVRAWDTATWESAVLTSHAYGAAGSRDGTRIAVAKVQDRHHLGIEMLDSDYRLIGMFEGSNTNILRADALAFSPDGKWLAAGGMKGEVCVWEVETLRLATRSTPHASFASGLAFSPDSRLLATGGASEQFIQLWNVPTWTKAGELSGHWDGVWGLAFTPKGGNLVSSSRDHTVKIWPSSINPRIDSLADAAKIAGFLPDGKTAVLLDSTRMKLWDLEFAQPTLNKDLTPGKVTVSGAISKDGSRLAVGCLDGALEIHETTSGILLQSFVAGSNPVGMVRFAPDAKTLAAISLPTTRPSVMGKLTLWNLGEAREMPGIPASVDGEASAVAFSNNGKWLAIARSDASIMVWDIAANRPCYQLKGHTWEVAGLAFSPDSRVLASASWDRTVKLWDMARGTIKGTLAGHPLGAGALCFSPDGRTLAVGSLGTVVTIWSVPAQQDVMTLHWNGFFLGELFFSTDGNTLAAGSFPLAVTTGFPMPDRVQFWKAAPAE